MHQLLNKVAVSTFNLYYLGLFASMLINQCSVFHFIKKILIIWYQLLFDSVEGNIFAQSKGIKAFSAFQGKLLQNSMLLDKFHQSDKYACVALT